MSLRDLFKSQPSQPKEEPIEMTPEKNYTVLRYDYDHDYSNTDEEYDDDLLSNHSVEVCYGCRQEYAELGNGMCRGCDDLRHGIHFGT